MAEKNFHISEKYNFRHALSVGKVVTAVAMLKILEELGKGDYYCTAKEFVKFMAFLNHTKTLISKKNRDLMNYTRAY